MHMPVLAQAAIDEIHNAGRNREAQSFTAAALRKNQSIDAKDITVHIDQRATAVSGIYRSIGLDVDHGTIGIGLPSYRTDDAHSDRILQAFGTSNRQYQLALMDTPRASQFKRGQ